MLKKQVGNSDPLMVARRAVVRGERKAASKCRLRTGETRRVLASQDPLLPKEAAASITRHSAISFGPQRLRPSAGRERGCKSDHLEPFLWVVAEGDCHLVGAGMSERVYLLIVSVVFLLFTVGNVLRFIFTPSGLEPAWPSLIAAAVTGFLSYQGFSFARKAPKG